MKDSQIKKTKTVDDFFFDFLLFTVIILFPATLTVLTWLFWS